MSEWLSLVEKELTKNPGLPLKDILNIAKLSFEKINKKNKNNKKIKK